MGIPGWACPLAAVLIDDVTLAATTRWEGHAGKLTPRARSLADQLLGRNLRV